MTTQRWKLTIEYHGVPYAGWLLLGAKSLARYSLLKRFIGNVEAGMPARSVGKKLDIAPGTATGIVKDWRERGHYEPPSRGGHLRPKCEEQVGFIENMVSRSKRLERGRDKCVCAFTMRYQG